MSWARATAAGCRRWFAPSATSILRLLEVEGHWQMLVRAVRSCRRRPVRKRARDGAEAGGALIAGEVCEALATSQPVAGSWLLCLAGMLRPADALRSKVQSRSVSSSGAVVPFRAGNQDSSNGCGVLSDEQGSAIFFGGLGFSVGNLKAMRRAPAGKKSDAQYPTAMRLLLG